mgnify:CR=1 FL=1
MTKTPLPFLRFDGFCKIKGVIFQTNQNYRSSDKILKGDTSCFFIHSKGGGGTIYFTFYSQIVLNFQYAFFASNVHVKNNQPQFQIDYSAS